MIKKRPDSFNFLITKIVDIANNDPLLVKYEQELYMVSTLTIVFHIPEFKKNTNSYNSLTV